MKLLRRSSPLVRMSRSGSGKLRGQQSLLDMRLHPIVSGSTRLLHILANCLADSIISLAAAVIQREVQDESGIIARSCAIASSTACSVCRRQIAASPSSDLHVILHQFLQFNRQETPAAASSEIRLPPSDVSNSPSKTHKGQKLHTGVVAAIVIRLTAFIPE